MSTCNSNNIILISGKFRAGFQPNHISLLTTAKKLKYNMQDYQYYGCSIVVAMNSDVSLSAIGATPIYTEADRWQMMHCVKDIDLVMTFDETTPLQLCKSLRPKVLIKGEDWLHKDVPERIYCGEVVFAPIVKKYHTTDTFGL